MPDSVRRPGPRPVPGALNLALLALVTIINAAALWGASHALRNDAGWWWVAAAAIVFSFANNTAFALMHEAVHGVFHSNKAVNRWGGRWVAALLRSGNSRVATQTSSGPYFDALDSLPPVASRLELLGSAVFQAGLFVALGLSWQAWLVCYAAFALNWSSLQYADHAFSPLDRDTGAWNLRVPRVVRWIFLNYHLHLAHHRHPNASWVHLPRLVDPETPRPHFLAIWWSMWRGPQPYPGPEQDRTA